MEQELITLILGVAEQHNATSDSPILIEKSGDAPLYGQDGPLDSLGLVSFVVAVEEAIEDEYDVFITLADEKAVSQRTSPFLTVGTLAKYADSCIQDEQANE